MNGSYVVQRERLWFQDSDQAWVLQGLNDALCPLWSLYSFNPFTQIDPIRRAPSFNISGVDDSDFMVTRLHFVYAKRMYQIRLWAFVDTEGNNTMSTKLSAWEKIIIFLPISAI